MHEPTAATLADVDLLGAVLGDAFTDDPVMTWAFPDPASRPRVLTGMFAFMARYLYVPHGQCTVLADAVALWKPSDTDDEPVWEEHGAEIGAVLDGHAERIGLIGAAMGEHHPTDPHRYLLAIGVRSGAQGQGLGSVLMAHTLAEIDAAGEAAYLEATSPRSRVLYERHGFEVVGEITVDDSPPMWPMWRAPR
jgi:GNAT superfamily N-acetyltransferase